jgi:PiT family inorganic phosphate transporter
MGMTELAYLTIALGLFFNFSNGFHDASNIVSTIVSSRAMSVRNALIMTALFVFLGSFALGTAVAKTIGESIVNTGSMTVGAIIAAVTAATAWNLFTWAVGLPSSSSHALIGGLIGAALNVSGVSSVEWKSVIVIFGVILASPLLGFVCAFHLTRLNFRIFRHFNPVKATGMLKKLQIFSGAMLAISHGTNDAQKAMGLITLSLLVLHRHDPSAMGRFYTPVPGETFAVPFWVILACSFALSLGMLSGGKRIIRTVGMKLYKVKPVHGFGAMLSTASVVYLCSLFGFPVSTTHIASSGIVGGGAAQRLGIVRWGLTKDILLTWIFTIPVSAGLAYLISMVLHRIL